MIESLDLAALREAYASGRLSPATLIPRLLEQIAEDADYGAWIRVLRPDELQEYLDGLAGQDSQSLPLYGVPFAIKDNIDLAGVSTTAACPAFAYTPQHSAAAVQRLVAAGAVPLGKTNMDQFAAGLVGTRSPYGVCRNAVNPEFISGGSSSGSAVAVARGHVSFALGTDTAGSGRVPAAFNGLVGMKPTRGLVSTRGVVPACASLDCVSVFSRCAGDAHEVLTALAGFDSMDPFSRMGHQRQLLPQRFSFGVISPESLEFFGDEEYAQCFSAAVGRLEALGGRPVTMDFAPFAEAARLLYQGPWVAERLAAIEAFFDHQPDAVFPVTREIIGGGRVPSAVDAFRGWQRLASLRRAAEQALAGVDVLVTPTAPTHYHIDAVLADPVKLNTNLGYYTNFMNLLDLSACAVPAGQVSDGRPFGITLVADRFADRALLDLAARLEGTSLAGAGPGAAGDVATELASLVVCGAHMHGLPLNHQLTERGATLRAATRTAPLYRLYALPGGPPLRPGMVRVAEGGAAIAVEVWDLPRESLGSFLEGVPAPLSIGRVMLADGSSALGFLCESWGLQGARDITAAGGWRAYLAGTDGG